MLAQDSHTFAIVDDDKRVLDGLRELLESVGYVVRTVPLASVVSLD